MADSDEGGKFSRLKGKFFKRSNLPKPIFCLGLGLALLNHPVTLLKKVAHQNSGKVPYQ